MIDFFALSIVLLLLTVLFSIPFTISNKSNYRYDDCDNVLTDLCKYRSMNPKKQHSYLTNKYVGRIDEGWIVAFKGFHKGMMCMNDFKYQEGKIYTIDCEPELCRIGFHACLFPRDVFRYYSIQDDVYHIVFIKDIDRSRKICNSDSKVCAKQIKIGPRIDSRYVI